MSADASDACVDAARRASRWCVEQTVNAEEGTWGQRCTKAQWDYHNLCH